MDRKYFGTDGIRGRVGVHPITPDFVLKLGWAVGMGLAQEGRRKVLIGKDTRISGYMFESALQAGLSAAGVDIRLLGPMPTPAIAYLTRALHADAGIVISASHNPFEDNGLKFFSASGMKLDDALEERIENLIDEPMTMAEPEALGKAMRVNDAPGRYIEFCKGSLSRNIDLKGIKVVLDCANGATYHIAPAVFHELGAEVITIANEPDGLNINVDCGATAPKKLAVKVLEHSADLGIAFDGDGDRVIMVDANGSVVDGDEILYIIAKNAKSKPEGVVGTLMSNLGMEHALKRAGIDFARANVGDRYVMEMLIEKGWELGGESSGHIICLNRTTTGDGIVAALQVLAVMVENDNSLAVLRQGMDKYPQTMINVRTEGAKDLVASERVQQAVKAVEAELNESGRVLLRPSGTEPLVRVMAEGEDAAQIERVVRQLVVEVENARDSA